ncbi:MAG: FAD-dependent oxidoreductase, partial [Actinomycetota bacterium]
MKKLNRRQVITAAAAASFGLAANSFFLNKKEKSEAAIAPVVIVGGGMAGATVAKYIRYWSAKSIPVILIDKNASYTSNVMSNLVLTGQKTLSSLAYPYTTLKSTTYGVTVYQGTVSGADINKATKTIRYRNSSNVLSAPITYSKLVLAPGLDFLPITGLFTAGSTGTNIVVGAWQAGAETQSLRDQLVAMPMDGKFIISIPKKPYRCPPGPYERAALVADWIKKNRRSAGNTSPQVFVLDGNSTYTVEPENFGYAFNTLHAGVVSYLPNATITSISTSTVPGSSIAITGTVNVSFSTGGSASLPANVINIIAPQTAGQVARDAGLATAGPVAGGGYFCPVDEMTYMSSVNSDIYVIGDACSTANQPKAGHMANAQAKVAADAIIRSLNAMDPDPSP